MIYGWTLGGAMTNIVWASVPLVDVAAKSVRVTVTVPKMDIGIAPCTEGAPMIHRDVSGRQADDS